MGRESRATDLGLLFLLASIWGGSFPFIKVAVEDFPPLSVVAGRLALGFVVAYPLLWLGRHRLPRSPRIWLDYLLIAVISNTIPFFLIAWGELTIDSGLAAILMGGMPLSAILLTHFLTHDEKLTPGKLAGVACGLLGLIVVIGPDALAGLGREIWAQLAIVGAGIGYALGGIYTRRRGLTRQPAQVNAAAVMLMAFLVNLPIWLLVDRPWTLEPTMGPVMALLGLGLLSTGFAYIILFRLLATGGVTFVALNNYLVPLFGLLWAWLFLDERPGPESLIGLALILLGVGLVQARLPRLQP